MELGAILVILGIALAIAAAFVTAHSVRLLAGAIVLVGLGVLFGVSKIVV